QTPVEAVAILIEVAPRKVAEEPVPSEVTEAMGDLGRMDFDRALEAAAKIIEARPKDPVGHNLQGGAYLGKKEYALARKSFGKALSLRPDDSEALPYLAPLHAPQNANASPPNRH